MRCNKCNSLMKIISEIKESPCLDYYAYCHGRDSTYSKEIMYKCDNCGEVQDIIEEDLATDKQMNLINKLCYKIAKRTPYSNFKEENVCIFTKEEANRVIKFLNSIIDINFEKYIDDYINNNVRSELLREYIKSTNDCEMNIFIEILKRK
ncbi:MAG: hypothetical protein ACRC1T_05565 [Clostridium chrysemydis]|uniref:hypothetical protein n=1 Tax=Clostridium chrysemydis TaxID=2665504 RepID=UPI003F35EC32